jgi:hypothetical protein
MTKWQSQKRFTHIIEHFQDIAILDQKCENTTSQCFAGCSRYGANTSGTIKQTVVIVRAARDTKRSLARFAMWRWNGSGKKGLTAQTMGARERRTRLDRRNRFEMAKRAGKMRSSNQMQTANRTRRRKLANKRDARRTRETDGVQATMTRAKNRTLGIWNRKSFLICKINVWKILHTCRNEGDVGCACVERRLHASSKKRSKMIFVNHDPVHSFRQF